MDFGLVVFLCFEKGSGSIKMYWQQNKDWYTFLLNFYSVGQFSTAVIFLMNTTLKAAYVEDTKQTLL